MAESSHHHHHHLHHHHHPSTSAEPVLKQGFLVKQGHVVHNWRTRWFILSKNCLEYHKTREDVHIKGKVPLVGASLDCLKPTESSKRPWVLRLTTLEGKEYLIGAPDQVTRDEWYLAIEKRILRLDPSKRSIRQKLTLTRSIYHKNENDDDSEDSVNHDIVQAMQDRSAGVELHEHRRGKHVYHYFSGSVAIDWLVQWQFVCTREQAVMLASELLKAGFFHPIDLHVGERGPRLIHSHSVISSDRDRCCHFYDSEHAKYIFVAYAPLTLDVMFGGHSDDEEELFMEDHDHDHDHDHHDHHHHGHHHHGSHHHHDHHHHHGHHHHDHHHRDHHHRDHHHRHHDHHHHDSAHEKGSGHDHHGSHSAHVNCYEDRIIRQGFLLKKGHLRRNWKTRMFILRDSYAYLCYYKGSKTHRLTRPQGRILLPGCCVISLDDLPQPAHLASGSYSSVDEPGTGPASQQPAIQALCKEWRHMHYRPNAFCIHTASGVDYYLQASSDEERNAWMADIQQHSALPDHDHLVHKESRSNSF